MHETHFAERIAAAVSARRKERGPDSVRAVLVRLGAGTHVTPDSLRGAFDSAAGRAGLSGVELRVETVEPRCVCEDCGAEFATDTKAIRCSECGSARVVLRQAAEMEMEILEA